MPPRRSHKKSRAGCRRCKVRKIKCDETHPRCGQCAKHAVTCDYDNPALAEELQAILAASTTSSSSAAATEDSPSSALTVTVPSPPTISSVEFRTPLSSPISPASPGTTVISIPRSPMAVTLVPARDPARDRLLELQLMHHYTSATCTTFGVNTPETENIWRTVAPTLAFSGQQFLLDAILGTAALHLRTIRPGDQELVRASHSYMSACIRGYCESLRSISSDNAEALFLTSALIAFQSSASRFFFRDQIPSPSENDAAVRSEPDPHDQSAYSPPLSWFHAFQGVKTVVATSWPWLRNSGIAIPIIDSQPSLQLDFSNPGSFFGHLLDGLDDELAAHDSNKDGQDTPMEGLAGLESLLGMSSADMTRQAYQHAVAVLNWAHNIPHPGAPLAFPATTMRRYVELLEERRPRALVILACFFAHLRSLEGLWWLQGVPRREVMGIASLIPEGSEWAAKMEWPIAVVQYEDASAIPPEVWGVDLASAGRSMGDVPLYSHIELSVFANSETGVAVPVTTA